MQTIFQQRLNIALDRKGWIKSQLSMHTGIDRASITNYFNGKNTPNADKLVKLATALDVTPSWLLGAENTCSYRNSPVRVPVLGYISAGIPIEQIEMVIDYEELPAEASRGGAEFFGLQVKGDSMEPEIRSGDIVILKKQSTCDNGEIAAVAINGDTATLKKISFSDTGIVMVQPINPKYNTVCYTKEQVESIPVTILGVLYEVRRKYKHG